MVIEKLRQPARVPRKVFSELKRFTKKVERTAFATRDGETLFGYRYVPKEEKRGTLLFVHGVDAGKDLGQYKVLMHRLAKEGFEVYSYDQRGHGQTTADFDIRKMQRDVADVLDVLKRRGVNDVVIGAHSLGGVIAAGGLVIAHDEGIDIPNVSLFAPFAPPRDFRSLEVIQHVLHRLKQIKQRNLPKPVERIGASVFSALLNPRFDRPTRVVKVARRMISFGKVRSDYLHTRDITDISREFKRAPNFLKVLDRLKHRDALPRTLVILGDEDNLVETNDPVKLHSYSDALRHRGTGVMTIPFKHDPPVISVAGEKDMFDLADVVTRLISRYAAVQIRREA